MRGEDDRSSARGFSAQHFGHDVGGDRVKPGERLIEDQQVGTVHQRCRQLNPLLVAVRELLDPRAHAIGQPETLEPRACGGPPLFVWRAVQHGEVLELIADPHLRIQAALLGHVADPLAARRVYRSPIPEDAARVGCQQPADDPHRGRLARPVTADKTEHAPPGNREAELIDRDQLAE